MNGSAWKKAIVFFCCLCCVPAILGQAGFILSHIEHDCTGLECPACARLREAVKLLRFSGVFLVFVLAAAVRNGAAAYAPLLIKGAFPSLTGISLKVRFNT
jgi:hypothetical protein